MNTHYVAFSAQKRIAEGTLERVSTQARRFFALQPAATILLFDTATGEPVDVDLRPQAETVVEEPKRLGRPKLGVVAREITLLPRHWDWLSQQPGGASVSLRKLVEEASRKNASEDARRLAQTATYRLMVALAGNAPNFEEANRALYRGERERFIGFTQNWPEDVRDQIRDVAFATWPAGS